MDKKQTPAQTGLPPELQSQLESWKTSNYAPMEQLNALRDMGSVIEEIFIEMMKNKGETNKFGALLTDIRTTLKEINDKETAEMPDYAKPVVAALNALEKSLTKAIVPPEFKPEFKPNIQVDSPQVSVSAPDLKGIEKIIKSDIPQAFREAIATIPVPEPDDDQPTLDALKEILTKLESVDTGVRLKPQTPNNMKVQNMDGSIVGGVDLFTELTSIAFGAYDSNNIPATITFNKTDGSAIVLTISETGGNITNIAIS